MLHFLNRKDKTACYLSAYILFEIFKMKQCNLNYIYLRIIIHILLLLKSKFNKWQ